MPRSGRGVPANEIRVAIVGMLWGHYGLVKARRQDIDKVDVTCELIVLLRRDGAGDEDAEVTYRLVDGVNDGLTVGLDIRDAVVEIEDPIQRLLGGVILSALEQKTMIEFGCS